MKVLIYLQTSKLTPKGGPYAVGYYIRQELKQMGVDNVYFINDGEYVEGLTSKQPSSLMLLFRNTVRVAKRYFRYKKIFNGKGIPACDLNQFEVIHFHRTMDMYECRTALEDYKGVVVLTSHSPVPLSKEIFDEYLLPFEQKYLKSFYSKLIEMDEFAFNRADYIHFPCAEAEEPYIDNWNDYKFIRKKRKDCYKYIPTGIPCAIAKRDRVEIRKELGISDDDFCVSYVGRHNIVKGYDKLKNIGINILKNSNTWIIVAGREAPLKRLENNHWIEIGWTNDAHSYISASDVFILPNAETYFDIVMLEVLSLGKIVIASNTGGNKHFKSYNPSGIFLYNTIEEAISIINYVKKLPKEEREKLGALNKKIFENNFTDKIFVDKYYQFITNIVSVQK